MSAKQEPKEAKKREEASEKEDAKKNETNVMSSPSELLSHMRDSTELNTTTTTKVELPSSLSSSAETKTTDRKSLIQELDESGKVIKKKKKKTKPAVRKGFLHRKSKTRLYSDEGSNEGAPAPSPYPWANVVDTRGMTPETLGRTMQEYGETGDVKTSCSDDMITKASRLPGEKKKKEKSSAMSTLENEKLDQLMNEADPELGRSTVEKTKVDGFGTKGFMNDLTRVLGASSDPSLRAIRDVCVEERAREKEEACDDVLVKGMQRKLLLKEPKRSIETKRSHVVLVLDVPEMDSMSDAKLDISETSVRFQSKQYRIDTPIPLDAISSTAKAKFSKRRSQLRVKFSRRRT